ncbi:NAD-dependent protein deacetylase, SIR2 family [uncultured Clostridium sp.]|jgi:NAD-dependent SIR2 family protein deacetylase|uniref:NAD-dependent protein deacetylase, SIR2 family n=1 Tax=uncultured Clostridium sp. TaxID=59620 RepID=UPI0026257C79|nr:NAD-dependent protein deacetylase, SIR2 family [uncultured Clostridium sp.]
MKNYNMNIDNIAKKIREADAVVIGIGAGMSASGGINYGSEKTIKELFPEYYDLGYRSIMEIQRNFWRLNDENALSYWGYWSKHIDKIRYQVGILSPYKKLFDLMKGKNYFVCTTNADGQVQKVFLDDSKIFAPQGNYDVFQCINPCTKTDVYPNKEMIDNMLGSINLDKEIDEKFIPRCPKCGDYLIPNLRCDDRFVEEPHMKNLELFNGFLQGNIDKNIVFLELGVGFNTPTIIRFPFEGLTDEGSNATLVRINKGMAIAPEEIESKSICMDEDIDKVLADILDKM